MSLHPLARYSGVMSSVQQRDGVTTMTYKEMFGDDSVQKRQWERLHTSEIEKSFWQDILANQGPIFSVWLVVMLINLGMYALHG